MIDKHFPCREGHKDMKTMRLKWKANGGFNLIKLMFGIGIGTLVLAGLATAFVPDFVPWVILMSAAILGIPLGSYLSRD